MVQLICGIVRFDGADASAEDLEAMVAAMSPAGKPVAQDCFVSGGVALAALHVSPGPEVPVLRPSIARRGNQLLAADVRLYAHGEIELHPPVSSVDALFSHLSEQGPAGLAALHGDFAFASYDLDSGRLTLGRDHFGVRPLQYLRTAEYVAFASLPAALLRTGLAPRDLDEEVVTSFPALLCAPAERTFFRAVKRVRQSHYVEFDRNGGETCHRYWRIPIEEPLPATLDPEIAERELGRLLVQAVHRRLPEHGDIAAHISGGLDSSSVGAIAARAVRAEGRTLHGYSYQETTREPGLPSRHDGYYADEAAAAEPNIELHRIVTAGTTKNILEAIDPETLLVVADGDSEQQVLRDVSSRGIDLLLSGWGGDQIVSSYGTAAESELFVTGHWRLLSRQLRALSRSSGQSVRRLFVDRVLKRCLPEAVRAFRRDPHAGEDFLAPGKRQRLIEKRKVFASSRRHRRMKMETWWQPHRLEMGAQLGAPHGVAYAFPMLDLDLIRYAMRLPGIFFHRDAVARSVLRGALKGILPETVRLRMEKKSPYFLTPYRDALMKDEAIRAAGELGQDPLVAEYLNMAKVEDYVRAGPDPDEVMARLRQIELSEVSYAFYHSEHLTPLALAIFLRAQRERSVAADTETRVTASGTV